MNNIKKLKKFAANATACATAFAAVVSTVCIFWNANANYIAANASESTAVSELTDNNLSKTSVSSAFESEEVLIWAPFSGLSVLCFRFSLV